MTAHERPAVFLPDSSNVRLSPPAVPAPRRRSQRELVAWSLLTRPDERAR